MADIKISELPVATVVNDADLIVLNQGGTTKTAARSLVKGGSGTVTSITAGTGLSGGTITDSGTIAVSYGITSGTAAQGNDSRLSDARTPTAHKSTHATGGSDVLSPSDIGALSATATVTGDLSGTMPSPTVAKIQGKAVSSTAPGSGQVLTWDGVQWIGATGTGGGGGANGLTYFLNQATAADAPTTNIPSTPHQLGRSGEVGQTQITTGTLPLNTWTLVAGFVSEASPLDPATTLIPAGLWDTNVWAYGDANVSAGTSIRTVCYVYSLAGGGTLTALGSPSSSQVINGTSAQYSLSMLVPQTTILATDRIYIAIEAYATGNNHTVTAQFGDSTPSHLHTSLGLVGGTGLWKNVSGSLQSPATLLFNDDVDPSAAIANSKIAGLAASATTDTTNASNISSGTLAVANGGTGATDAGTALFNLGAPMHYCTVRASANQVGTATATTFTYTATGAIALEGVTVAVGDVVLFTNQTTTPQMGPWVCTTAGATGVAQVMTRPSWFTGTAPAIICYIQRGTTSSGNGYNVYPLVAATTDIVVGTTTLGVSNNMPRGTVAILGSNTFSANTTQTFGAGTATTAPFKFQAGVVQTTPVAHGVEWDGTLMYLTNAAGVRTTNTNYVAIPATATSTGQVGQQAVDNAGSWLYVCTATNVWKRVLLATF